MATVRAQNVAIRGSRLGNLLEEFPYAATVANQDNVLVFVNRAFTQVYGWEEKEIISLTPRLLVPPDFPEFPLGRIRHAISKAPTGSLELAVVDYQRPVVRNNRKAIARPRIYKVEDIHVACRSRLACL